MKQQNYQTKFVALVFNQCDERKIKNKSFSHFMFIEDDIIFLKIFVTGFIIERYLKSLI